MIDESSRQRTESSEGAGAAKRFFILGCQRSGTTLLRLVLECHSRVSCFDEQKSYPALADNDYREAAAAALVGFKIPCWTEQLRDEWLYDMGQGIWSRQFYRGDPLIFILRDVRDVVASMMNLKMFGTNWWSAFGHLTLKMKLKSRRFRERYGRELEIIGDPNVNHAGAAALYWKYKVEAFDEYRELGWPVYGVRYEQLVANPAEELQGILDFLGLAWEDGLLNHPQFRHTELNHEGKAMGDTDPLRSIDRSSVERWRKVLSPEQIELVTAVAGNLNTRIIEDEKWLKPFARPFARQSDAPASADVVNNRAPEMSDKFEATLDWLAERDRAAFALTGLIMEKERVIRELEAKVSSSQNAS